MRHLNLGLAANKESFKLTNWKFSMLVVIISLLIFVPWLLLNSPLPYPGRGTHQRALTHCGRHPGTLGCVSLVCRRWRWWKFDSPSCCPNGGSLIRRLIDWATLMTLFVSVSRISIHSMGFHKVSCERYWLSSILRVERST